MAKKGVVEQALESGLRYVGQDRAHLTGIPARSLTPEDLFVLSAQQIQECLESGLYKLARKEVKDES